MSKHDKNPRKEDGWSDITDAALALERELRRFEELGQAARRMPLDTRNRIERAAKATTEAASEQERVGTALSALVAAITAARQRHEANAAALQERGEEIRRRAEQLGVLYEQYSALGEEGRVVNQLVQEAAARQRDASTPEQIRDVVAAIEAIEERMAKLVDGARELGQAAVAASITDLAEQADGMRQQVAAAKNKIGLLRKSLAVRLPEPDPSKLN